MKYLILLSLLLVGCAGESCPKDDWREYYYGDKVNVISGFYKGSEGIIIDRTWIYNSNDCITRAFKIELQREGHAEVTVSQYDLYKPELR